MIPVEEIFCLIDDFCKMFDETSAIPGENLGKQGLFSIVEKSIRRIFLQLLAL